MDNNFGVKGKRICFLGNLSFKKGPMVLLLAFNEIHKFDPEFTLHLGGRVDDPRAAVYLDATIKDLELLDSIHYHGYIDNPLEWFENFDYGICTSPLEGNPVGVLEFLSAGLHPLLYSFVGCRDQFPPDYIWKDFDELIAMVKLGPGKPKKYQNFVKNHYSLDKQLSAFTAIIAKMAENAKKPKEIPPKSTVSAVLAVKNGSKTIKKAIESLLNQTYPLTKIIVVNDGSTDDTEDIVRQLFDTSKIPIEIITNPVSKWVFSARNQGFKNVDSDFFFFLDADDWVDKNYVEKMSTILDENANISIVYPDMLYFDGDGNEKMYPAPDFDPQVLVQRNFIAYASMQRTAIFKDACGYSDYLNDCRNHLSEWDLWLRYVKAGVGFKRLAEPLFHYFNSGDEQMSNTYEYDRSCMHLQMAIGITDGGKDIQMVGDKKRILLVCHGREYLDHSKVSFEVYSWAKPLEEFGEVYTFFYDVEAQYYGREQMLERLKTFNDLVKPTYIFHPSYKDDIPVSVWSDLSKAYKTIVWNSDNHRHESFCKKYDIGFRYAVTTYKEVYDKMDHSGRILSQWACNQHYFGPKEKDIDVSFCGQKYGERAEFLDGLGVECYGKGWGANSFLDFPKMASVLGRSKISINFSKGGDGGPQLKLRPFEVCGSNTLCLCEHVDGLSEFYEIGKEIITFRTKKELAGAINYYLTNDEERIAIAQAGYKKTLSMDLWSHRLTEIFSIVDGK